MHPLARPIRRFLVVAAGAGALAACTSPTTLTRDAAGLRALAPETVTNAAVACESLGEISKRNTNTLQARDDARKDALHKALNDAAARGATHVTVSPYYNSVGGACDDCAEIDVEAFRCDGEVSDMTVVDAVVAANPSDAPPARADVEAQDEGESEEGLPEGEANHDDHDAVCEALDVEPPDEPTCRADTECLVCQSGARCGEPVTRGAFMDAGPACARAPESGCEPVVAYCCAGRCVLSD